jgi:hypothetical protein
VLSVVECLAKAAEMDSLAEAAPWGDARTTYAEIAANWRLLAQMALLQDQWTAVWQGLDPT